MVNNQLNIIKEPTPEWGGSWTSKKLDAFSKYVWSYLTIMKKHPNWKTIYFDGFAGSGISKTNCDTPLYTQLSLTEEEVNLYQGSAERVLSNKDNLLFNYYYFIDLKEESIKKLKVKLAPFQSKIQNEFQYRSGDCNQWITKLGVAMKKRKNEFASLVFLDPFGMQINWDSIASLKETRTDIWILVPTGVIVNRLLDKACKLKHTAKLQSFFGLSEEEIKKEFYQKTTQNTLFGKEEITTKIAKPIEKIANLYVKQLGTIWKYVSDKPLKLVNSRGVPIFHLVFASNNATALKIAKQIIVDN